MYNIYKMMLNEYENMFRRKKFEFLRIILCYYRVLEYRVIVLIRIYLMTKNKYLKGICRKKLLIKYNVEIGIRPKIGKNLRFAHFQGVIIGNEVEIGDNCILYQQVTLGQKENGLEGYGKDPKLGNNVIVFAGAKVVGKIKVGDNAIIGANSVVIKDVPNDCNAVGIPAVIKERRKKNEHT